MANSLSSSIVVSNVLYLKASSEGYPDDRSEVGRQQFVSSQWKPSASPALNCTSQQQSHKIDPQFPSPPLSPRSSSPPSEDWFRRGVAPQQGPPNDSLRPDLLAVCKAFETQMQDMQRELDPRFHEQSEQVLPWVDTRNGYEPGSVPVFVMLPLDTVRVNNTVHRKRAMDVSLRALKTAGVEGVMVDVWWGIVEREAPGQYNWSGYRELLEMVRRHGLKVQTVMSFHQCGGNVGDSVNIPLPKWVVEEIDRDNDLAYSDQLGRRNYEYVSLGCDDLPVLKGRTPVQCYADYMRSFKENFQDLIGETIVEIQIGMGPAGELRYPSYPETNGTWKFSGTGAFQCYDKYMLANLKAKAETAGKEKWGYGGPTDAGNYNSWPEDTDFFRSEGGWNSLYGEFFLQWYSGMLLDHGERILAAGESIFRGTGARLSGKVAGIHWHYGTRSHAAELTAGYYNTQLRDGYLPIATLFARHGVVFNFTCIEMKDVERPENAKCFPEKLIKQVIRATRKAWVALSGENALPRFDESALQQIINNSSLRLEEDNADDKVEPMCAFTYLRMSEHLFQRDNWIRFVSFVRRMSQGVTPSNSCNDKHKGTRPLIKGATS